MSGGIQRSDRLADRVVVVTGAGSGIGAAFAVHLAAAGACVIVADQNAASAEAVAEAIVRSGGRGKAVVADVTDPVSVSALFDAAERAFGGVVVLFNNAGVSLKEPFLTTTEEQWDLMHVVNGVGVLLCTQEAVRRLIARGVGGKIVNTCSTSSRHASADFSAYAASKAAVLSLTHSSARALARYGITVNGIGPGIVRTRLWDEMERNGHGAVVAGAESKDLEGYSGAILLGRVGTPEDIAPTAVFLASPESDYITGQLIMVDGGMVLG